MNEAAWGIGLFNWERSAAGVLIILTLSRAKKQINRI